MDHIGIVERIAVNLFGKTIMVSMPMFAATWMVMAVILMIAYLGARNLQRIPGKMQSIMEMFVSTFKGLTYEVLPPKLAKKYTPLIATIFIFVVISNWFGILPPIFKFIYIVLGWFKITGQEWLLHMPAFEEPTKYLSTCLALGLMVFFIVQYESIKAKGLWGYFKSFAEPIVLFAPLNIIGEIAKVISHSFRLFGNILGGSIIIIIVSYLLKYLILPPLLNAFFGLFVGAIQAFVFTMLAVTYIAVAVND